ncbi:type III secretion system chaperone [Kalamiella sp. sgz302252]|uniref:type III secretion system chaperone n=1 Tax=Pantoea sp. sgz302252 TaxID=3341827 RepID=UPI0036D30852
MPSTDVADLIETCLNSASGELALWIDEMPIRLQRLPGGWFFFAELQLPAVADERLMRQALKLTGPALLHYGEQTAALCLNPQRETLCLLLRLTSDRLDEAVALLESLCNQCEIWQETLLSLMRPTSL